MRIIGMNIKTKTLPIGLIFRTYSIMRIVLENAKNPHKNIF